MATQTSVQTGSIPDILEPYFLGNEEKGITGLLGHAQDVFSRDYADVYGEALQQAGLAGEGRVAGLSPLQQQVADQLASAQTPEQFAQAQALASQAGAGLGALMNQQATQVSAPSLQNYQMNQPTNVSGSTNNVAPQMATARANYNPNIQTFSMNQPRDVQAAGNVQAQALRDYSMQGPAKFDASATSQYMSPYIQQVIDVQKAEALRDAQKNVVGMNLGSARQGTYGGARNALANAEANRNLQTQLGNIQATGLQSAYDKAMSQFNASTSAEQSAAAQNLQAQLQTQQLGSSQSLEAQKANQAAQQQAALANQQAALTTGQQNLAAQQAAQQLGVQTGSQMALANLSAEQQANVQNQAAQLQTQGLNAQQAMQAALANQQAALTTGQANLQANLGIQQLGAQQSLAAQQANQQANLQAAQQSAAAAAGLGNIAAQTGQLGVAQQAAELDLLKTQGAMGDLQRSIAQQGLDTQYQDLMAEQNFDQTQLGGMANILRGVPVTDTTQTVTTPPPSFASQLSGVGLTGLATYNMLKPTP